MVARMLGAAPVLADAVIEALSASSDPANSSSRPPGAETESQAEALSATVWHAIWPVERCVCMRWVAGPGSACQLRMKAVSGIMHGLHMTAAWITAHQCMPAGHWVWLQSYPPTPLPASLNPIVVLAWLGSRLLQELCQRMCCVRASDQKGS